MAVTLSNDQLPELLESLQENPHAYNIRGEITSKLNSVITDYDFTVDSWPDYKALVVRVNPTKAGVKYPRHLARLVCTFALDRKALETLLETPEILDWSCNYIFLYVSPVSRPIIENAIGQRKKPYEVRDLHFLRVTKDTLKISPIPDGFKVGRVRPEQASLVSSTFVFNTGEHTEAYIRHIVEHLPSCCLYNREGDMVGFCLQYHFGALGMLYVPKERRGNGYGQMIVSHLASVCLEAEKEVYVISKHDNVSSVALHQRIGFEIIPESKCTEIWVNPLRFF